MSLEYSLCSQSTVYVPRVQFMSQSTVYVPKNTVYVPSLFPKSTVLLLSTVYVTVIP